MPRKSRMLSESKIYHVMIRGNEKKDIFLDDEDRTRFINTLYEKRKDKNYILYAYCLMKNHVHLLVNEGEENISDIMKRINVSYAYYFNRKYNRIGHLFQDRFKSEAIDSDRYLLAASRYIHNNPVKAKLVQEASQYQWSSYCNYIHENSYLGGIVNTEEILSLFHSDRKKAIKLLVEFTRQPNDDRFIEYKEENNSKKSIQSEKEANQLVGEFLNEKGMKKEDLKLNVNIGIRNELISVLRSESFLSIRQISSILGLDRNVVQRVKIE